MNAQSLTVSGPVTIYEVSDWREQMLHCVKTGTALNVDLHTSGPWDTAGLQLLISLVLTGQQRDCEIRFQLVPKVCRDIAKRAGLSQWLAERSVSEL
jgi:ABC-type transporter Mla MlaB component